jgi:hypothetical protein
MNASVMQRADVAVDGILTRVAGAFIIAMAATSRGAGRCSLAVCRWVVTLQRVSRGPSRRASSLSSPRMVLTAEKGLQLSILNPKPLLI